eukprot:PhM_4_TR2454/c2_g1_i1/m.66799
MNRARVGCRTGAVKGAQEGAPLQFSVVGENEFREWQQIAHSDEVAAAEAAREGREALLKSSKERVANWPNTIEALRRRKEQARQERLDEEERRRCIIDENEAELAKAKRKSQIDKANLMLYETDDRVKNFTSKMVLAAVLEERSKQIEIAKTKHEQEYANEMKWAVVQEETLRRANKEEEIKQKQLRDRARQFKQGQIDQLESIKQQKLSELRMDKDEGLKIKKAAEESLKQEIEEETKRRNHAKAVQDELIVSNKRQQELKAERKRQEALEAEQVARFAKHKEEQMQERKRRVEDRFQKKLQVRQDIIDRQAAHLQ